MTALVLRCLGTLEIALAATASSAFPTDKVRALLTYLALETDQPHRREELAILFWPEMPQAAALNNLRVALHRLRESLDKVQPGSSATLLISTRQTVHLNPAALQVDVTTFQVLLAACAAHDHRDLPTCDDCLMRLIQAADLYRGELLAGFSLADAPAFEEWLLLCREILHQQAITTLNSLVHAYEQRGDDHQSYLYAGRLLALDPYREDAHRQLMRILARRGLYTEALGQYETCRRLLHDQVGVEPAIETIALYEQIRAEGRGTRSKELPDKEAQRAPRREGDKIARGEALSPSPPLPLSPSPGLLFRIGMTYPKSQSCTADK